MGVGVFVLGGLLLFAVGLFMIGQRRMLFAEQFEVYAEFAELAGVESGAKVRVSGMDAGEITEISVPPGPGGHFRVRMRILEDLHQIVRVDSVATIQTDGLVGNKLVEIGAGSEGALPVPDGSTIDSREPFDLEDLTDQMTETVQLLQATFEGLRIDLSYAVGQMGETVDLTDTLIEDIGRDVKTITTTGTRVVSSAQTILEGIRGGRGTVGRLVTDDELYKTATEMARQANQAIRNMREASEEAKEMVASLRGDLSSPDGATGGLVTDLRSTLGYANEAMADLADDAEALKRNWLFRGYFERRGYYDLDGVTVAEYRAGALTDEGRDALRIWVAADVLFESHPEGGGEVLSAGGRARLDSAMSQFLRHPESSPLIVEGYASAPTVDAEFLAARSRAVLVRDYLGSRFHMDGNRLGIMPMGAEASGSPDGDTWNGVALALFVRPDARAATGTGS